MHCVKVKSHKLWLTVSKLHFLRPVVSYLVPIDGYKKGSDSKVHMSVNHEKGLLSMTPNLKCHLVRSLLPIRLYKPEVSSQ